MSAVDALIAGAAGAAGPLPLPLHGGDDVWLRLDAPASDDAWTAEEVRLYATDAGGAVVGYAAYVRVYGPRAAMTLDVDEAFWHSGLAELLVVCVRALAARAEISALLLRACAGDVRLLAMLRERFAAREDRDGDVVAVEISTDERRGRDRAAGGAAPDAGADERARGEAA